MRSAVPLLLLIPALAHADPAPVQVTYDRGTIFTAEGGGFELRFTIKNQVRVESTRPTEADAETSTRFYVPRSRLGFDGRVFDDATRFKVELAVGDRGSFGFVKDVLFERGFADRKAWLRVGQWKRPFNRQDMGSDFNTVFNERAATGDFVGGGRDLGVAIQSDIDRSPDGVEWALGVFNGFSGGADRPSITTTCAQDATSLELDCATAPPANIPADFGPAIIARVGWNHGGIKAYSEGDLEGGPLRFGVAAAYKVDLADLDGDPSHGVGADAVIKVHGLDVTGGVAMIKVRTAGARYGGFVQAGYFVRPRKVQVAARFAIAPTTPAREQVEVRAAVNWYWHGHTFKWLNDVGVLQQTGEDPTTTATDRPDVQARSMVQLVF